MKTNTTLKTLDVPIPDLETHEIRYTVSLKVPIHIDEDGTELLTNEAAQLIQKTQARHLGLLSPEEIKLLRKRLNKTQKEMSTLLGCGAKSYTRWETGHSRPTRMVNNLLRLLWCGKIALSDLEAMQTPRLTEGKFTTRHEITSPATACTASFAVWVHNTKSEKTITLNERRLHKSQVHRTIWKNEFSTTA